MENAPTVQYQRPRPAGRCFSRWAFWPARSCCLQVPARATRTDFDVSVAKAGLPDSVLRAGGRRFAIMPCQAMAERDDVRPLLRPSTRRPGTTIKGSSTGLQQQLIDRITQQPIADNCTIARRQASDQPRQSSGVRAEPGSDSRRRILSARAGSPWPLGTPTSPGRCRATD